MTIKCKSPLCKKRFHITCGIQEELFELDTLKEIPNYEVLCEEHLKDKLEKSHKRKKKLDDDFAVDVESDASSVSITVDTKIKSHSVKSEREIVSVTKSDKSEADSPQIRHFDKAIETPKSNQKVYKPRVMNTNNIGKAGSEESLVGLGSKNKQWSWVQDKLSAIKALVNEIEQNPVELKSNCH